MSGNRANAAAIQRRTVSQGNVAPPGGRPTQGQGQPPLRQPANTNARPIQRQNAQQAIHQQQQQKQSHVQAPVQNPKMSVSDAIGLLSLRLGRVETYILQLPPLDQLNLLSSGAGSSGSGSEELGENMRVVDDAVFTNIVARLEKMDKTIKAQPQGVSVPDSATTQSVSELKETVGSLKSEIKNLKELMLSLQSFTMQTNQKLINLTLNQSEGNELLDSSVYTQGHGIGIELSNIDINANDDDEILAEDINLNV